MSIYAMDDTRLPICAILGNLKRDELSGGGGTEKGVDDTSSVRPQKLLVTRMISEKSQLKMHMNGANEFKQRVEYF